MGGAALPWGAAALEAARRGPGLLVIRVDDAGGPGAPDDEPRDGAHLRFPSSGALGRASAEPVHVAIEGAAQPAVALRVRWTLRALQRDEAVPHAVVYAVRRRSGRLLPLFAAADLGDSGTDAGALARFMGGAADAEARATKLRRALVASAQRGWRARRPVAAALTAAVAAVNAALDPTRSALHAAPGSPRPPALALLLVAARPGDGTALAPVRRTLEAMVDGGMRDPLDGGFFRAARSPDWRVPDFARTADLNAALLEVYAGAATQLGEPAFAAAARGIASYLLGTLRDPGTGAFFAGQAVDESYYTWTSAEVTAALPTDLVQTACLHFNIQPAARVVADPSRNVLYAAADAEAIARFTGQPVADVVGQLADARARLVAARAARAAPRLDRARYVDVNARVASALLAGARSLGVAAWRTAALQTLTWLEDVCFEDGRPALRYRGGDPYLGDHAALGRVLLDAHGDTGEPRYLERAETVAASLLALFHDRRHGVFLDAPRDSLVNRAFWPEQPLEDLAGVSAVATTIRLLLDLGRRTRRARYHRAALAALRAGAGAASDDPLAAAGYYLALADATPTVPA
jgi:hypothetical protein